MDRQVESTETVKRRRPFFRLGPAIALLIFARALAGTVFTDLIIYRACIITLNIDPMKCLMLRANNGSPEAVNLETKVEPYASAILMSKSVLESILPAVLSLFLGPWSDRGGRRPLLLAAFSGFTLMYISLSVICDWMISPWYLLITSIPAIITGGMCTVMLASICHISDTTKEKDRMVQLSLFEVSYYGGKLLGTLIAPLIYESYGYNNLFRISAVCCILAVIYVYLFIPETVNNASKESIRGLFKISFVKDLMKNTFAKRIGFNRSVVWLVISIFTLSTMITGGYANIDFLFTRARLSWDVRNYSFLCAVETVMRITGLCSISILTPVFGFSDTFLAGVSLLSSLGDAITRSLVWQSWHMYLSVCIGVFSGVSGPVMRSIISKSVPAQDVGKIFSLMAFLESLSPLGGAPLYTLIYSQYLPPIYPLPVYLFSAIINASLILCVICIHILLKESNKSCSYIPASQDDNLA